MRRVLLVKTAANFTCQLFMPTCRGIISPAKRELLHLPTSHASFSRVTSPANTSRHFLSFSPANFSCPSRPANFSRVMSPANFSCQLFDSYFTSQFIISTFRVISHFPFRTGYLSGRYFTQRWNPVPASSQKGTTMKKESRPTQNAPLPFLQVLLRSSGSGVQEE